MFLSPDYTHSPPPSVLGILYPSVPHTPASCPATHSVIARSPLTRALLSWNARRGNQGCSYPPRTPSSQDSRCPRTPVSTGQCLLSAPQDWVNGSLYFPGVYYIEVAFGSSLCTQRTSPPAPGWQAVILGSLRAGIDKQLWPMSQIQPTPELRKF